MKTPRYIVCVKEAGDDVNVIGRIVLAEFRLYWPSSVCIDRVPSVLAEFRLYWPSWAVLAEFVTHMIRTAFAI